MHDERDHGRDARERRSPVTRRGDRQPAGPGDRERTMVVGPGPGARRHLERRGGLRRVAVDRGRRDDLGAGDRRAGLIDDGAVHVDRGGRRRPHAARQCDVRELARDRVGGRDVAAAPHRARGALVQRGAVRGARGGPPRRGQIGHAREVRRPAARDQHIERRDDRADLSARAVPLAEAVARAIEVGDREVGGIAAAQLPAHQVELAEQVVLREPGNGGLGASQLAGRAVRQADQDLRLDCVVAAAIDQRPGLLDVVHQAAQLGDVGRREVERGDPGTQRERPRTRRDRGHRVDDPAAVAQHAQPLERGRELAVDLGRQPRRRRPAAQRRVDEQRRRAIDAWRLGAALDRVRRELESRQHAVEACQHGRPRCRRRGACPAALLAPHREVGREQPGRFRIAAADRFGTGGRPHAIDVDDRRRALETRSATRARQDADRSHRAERQRSGETEPPPPPGQRALERGEQRDHRRPARRRIRASPRRTIARTGRGIASSVARAREHARAESSKRSRR